MFMFLVIYMEPLFGAAPKSFGWKPNILLLNYRGLFTYGGDGGIRTHNPLGHEVLSLVCIPFQHTPKMYGASGRTRTCKSLLRRQKPCPFRLRRRGDCTEIRTQTSWVATKCISHFTTQSRLEEGRGFEPPSAPNRRHGFQSHLLTFECYLPRERCIR